MTAQEGSIRLHERNSVASIGQSLADRMVERTRSLTLALLDSRCGTYPERQRIYAAAEDDIDPERLALMADDSSEKVRRTVAWNGNASEGILRNLASDPSDIVRKSAAGNANLPGDAADSLAADHDPRVRGAVVFNDVLSIATVERMTNDPDPLVRHAAKGVLFARSGGLARTPAEVPESHGAE